VGNFHADLAVARAADDAVLLVGLDPVGGTFSNLNQGGFVGGWLGWSTFSGPPVLSRPTLSSSGQVSLSWTDGSTQEDAHAVFRVKSDGSILSELADMPTPNKAGTGETITKTDTAPVTNAPQRCYKVFAYDYNAAWVGAQSDVMCV